MSSWDKLLCTLRLGQEQRPSRRLDARSEFKRDYDRLIFSAPFRRMQNKTQVFPLPGSIFVHNRLTHTLEVASVGMSLGDDVARQLLCQQPELADSMVTGIGQVVAAACLAHDMGNPPFGHSGEKAIQAFFTEGQGQQLQQHVSPQLWQDLIHFEGNANAFRLLTHRFKGRRQGGYAMTYTMLASIVKYPFASTLAGSHGKFGFFHTEQPCYERIAAEMGIQRLSAPGQPLRYARHPLVYLVEAADDICYELMDLEDAHKLGLVSHEDTCRMMLDFLDDDARQRIHQRIADEELTDLNERVVYMRACVIGLLERECVSTFMQHQQQILDGTFSGSLIEHIGERPRRAYRACVDFSRRHIYATRPVLDVELSGYHIIQTLLERYTEAIQHPQRFYSRQLLDRVASQYEVHDQQLDVSLHAVVDYISGMTDLYALDLYQKICGIALPVV